MLQQCPKCELRFTTESELEDHLERDHHRLDATEPDVPHRGLVHRIPHSLEHSTPPSTT